jgi:hypothetical protein
MRLICFTGKMPTRTATTIERSIANQEILLILDICYLISKTGSDDVRWEKVERVKRILSGVFRAPEASRCEDHRKHVGA